MSKLQKDIARETRDEGIALVGRHALFAPLWKRVRVVLDTDGRHVSSMGWLAVSEAGWLYLNPKRRAGAAEWARQIAQVMICLGFGLVARRVPQTLWEIASLLVAMRFCDELKIGRVPEDMQGYPFPVIPKGGVEALFRQFVADGCSESLVAWHRQFSGKEAVFHPLSDDQRESRQTWAMYQMIDWKGLLAEGIARNVGQALEVAGGRKVSGSAPKQTLALRARQQLIDSHPLLGALAASFDIEEDPAICARYDIRIAAIDVGARKIWMNAAAHLSAGECLFVFAHELLHAGLNHASRRRGRDSQLWNVACDFVINGWLIEMGVGTPPAVGLLHDSRFANRSSEEIYDELAQDIRRARKLATLRGGAGECDMFGEDAGSPFTDAEAYCRRALAQGMERCLYGNYRGTLPAGLIEEIRSLSQPPIPWDVRLAEWFNEHFPPPESCRTYARPSRRQSATPDIPRPAIARPTDEQRAARVFGVVLDTSGSMEPQTLGKALGAIASYSMAHDVFAVRLICCDAHAYDSGWVEPERLLDTFSLRGRGGTVLQPGIDLLHDLGKRGDFPSAGPVLIITDGWCEARLDIVMEHAYLLPEGRRLPFATRAEIFSIR